MTMSNFNILICLCLQKDSYVAVGIYAEVMSKERSHMYFSKPQYNYEFGLYENNRDGQSRLMERSAENRMKQQLKKMTEIVYHTMTRCQNRQPQAHQKNPYRS